MPEGAPVEIDQDGQLYYRPLDIAVSIAGRTRSEAEAIVATALATSAGQAFIVQLRTPPVGYDSANFEVKPARKDPARDSPEASKPKPPPDPLSEKQQEYRYFIIYEGKRLQTEYEMLQKSPKSDKLSDDFLRESEAFHKFVDWFEQNENSPKLLKTDPGKVYGSISSKILIAGIEKDVKRKLELEEEAKRYSPEVLEARGKKWDEFFRLAMFLKGESSRRFPYSIPLDSEGADILVTGDPVRQAVLDRIADELMGWSREHFSDDNFTSVDPQGILSYILKSGYKALLDQADLFPLEHERIDRHELIPETVLGAFASTLAKGLAAVAVVGGAVGLGIISAPVALVLLGGLAAYSGITSYLARRKDIEEKGYDVPVAATVIHSMGDVIDVSQTIEGITGERLGTHEQLTSVEMSQELGGGLGGIAVLLVGSRAYELGQGVGRTLRLSGPALVPETLEGVPAGDLKGLYPRTTAPVKPLQYPNPAPIEAAARAKLPERLRVGFDRWMETMRSNPKNPDIEKVLGKMTDKQIEAISRTPAENYYAQLAESERLKDAAGRSQGDPLRPNLKHVEWHDGVTVHYEKTPPSPSEIALAQRIQKATGEPVHVFGDTPSNQSYPGIDGTIGEPPRPLQLKDVHGPEWLKVRAHEAYANAAAKGYSNVEVHLSIPDSTVAECKAGWEGKPAQPQGEKIGWETGFSPKNTLPLAKIVIHAKDGVWEVPAPPTSPNLPGVPLPSSTDDKKKAVGATK
jgi:hypothetical protein